MARCDGRSQAIQLTITKQMVSEAADAQKKTNHGNSQPENSQISRFFVLFSVEKAARVAT